MASVQANHAKGALSKTITRTRNADLIALSFQMTSKRVTMNTMIFIGVKTLIKEPSQGKRIANGNNRDQMINFGIRLRTKLMVIKSSSVKKSLMSLMNFSTSRGKLRSLGSREMTQEALITKLRSKLNSLILSKEQKWIYNWTSGQCAIAVGACELNRALSQESALSVGAEEAWLVTTTLKSDVKSVKEQAVYQKHFALTAKVLVFKGKYSLTK